MNTLESNYELLQMLEPRALWDTFTFLAATPRESGHEAGIRARLAEAAEVCGFAHETDEAGNLLIRVPAKPGFENSPIVVLQGHLDMVCTKRADSTHNFATDPIRLVRDGDWLKADGTTLGADNGIGVAAALAAAIDPSVQHGPLEILLTIDEEAGMTGALGLAPGWLQGKILLNLDSEEPGAVYLGCAGGAGVESYLTFTWAPVVQSDMGYYLRVSGLRGGHSGGDIHENRGNAVKFLTRALTRLLAKIPAEVADFRAGDRHNAIPREGQMHLSMAPGLAAQAAGIVATVRDELAAEFPKETGFQLVLEDAPRPTRRLNYESVTRLAHLLTALPNGVVAMSTDLPGLVETSTSLATVRTCEETAMSGRVLIHSSPRSSNAQALRSLIEQIQSVSRLASADTSVREPYPGWQPNLKSRIVRLFSYVQVGLHGFAPKQLAIHAGLECGVIGQKYPDMDMCSFGPHIIGAHSPDEAVSIESVSSFWETLTELLAAIAQGDYDRK